MHDPRTNGPMPSSAIGFLAGTDTAGIMKDDGTYFSTNAQAPDSTNSLASIVSGKMVFTGTDDRLELSNDIHTIVADDFADQRLAGLTADLYPHGNGSPPKTVAAAGIPVPVTNIPCFKLVVLDTVIVASVFVVEELARANSPTVSSAVSSPG